jgi:hypothetical protein
MNLVLGYGQFQSSFCRIGSPNTKLKRQIESFRCSDQLINLVIFNVNGAVIFSFLAYFSRLFAWRYFDFLRSGKKLKFPLHLSWVSQETLDISVVLLVPREHTTARSESSKWVVKLPTPRLGPSEFTQSECVVEIPNSVLFVLNLETFRGELNPLLASLVLSRSFTIPPITNWSEPILW